MKIIDGNSTKKFNNYTGFTLVELIVVITILSILGTISLVSIQGYGSQARDSDRITTFSFIKTGLEMSYVKIGQYPMPEGVVSSGSINGNTLAYVGEVQENITRLTNISKPPKDPLSDSYYAYGTDVNKRYYQIAGVWENPTAYNNIISPVYADNGYVALVVGNYNGLLMAGTGICNLPSLVFAGSGDLLLSTVSFIVNKQSNLPYKVGNQINLNPKLTSEVLNTLTNGSAQTLACKTLPKSMEEFTTMATDLSQLGYPLDTIGQTAL